MVELTCCAPVSDDHLEWSKLRVTVDLLALASWKPSSSSRVD
ncbi:hypothetical protein SLEP1_g16444 [Rubroshorea leprosula]|uniref:Uncharacterized protein n=1 Tax=Rubroshorea leprosula TaxID=152421 RepID=A0AAV5IQY4_9ROSI|nr:hypothetical protein SLEP1_g16444 [Rubroshorea leprosula]